MIIGLTLWKFIWINKYKVEIPDPKSVKRNQDNYDTIKHDSMFAIFKTYWPIYVEFNPEYWIKICGLDAYSYLLF